MRLRAISGFSLVEVMIALGIATISSLAIAVVFTELAQIKEKANFEMTLSEIRLTFQRSLMQPQDWQMTRANNPAMSCFQGPSAQSCLAQSLAPAAPWPFKLYNAKPAVIYDATSSVSGYTKTGTPCATFPNQGCLLKPVLTFALQCDIAADPNCMGPTVAIDLTFQYAGPSLGPINFSAYGFHIVNGTFPFKQTGPCSGIPPVCSASQQDVCVSGAWTCEEFGP